MTPRACEKSKYRVATGTATAAVTVVDDDEEFRTLARRLLETAGFEVSEAGTVAECLTQISSSGADAIILDIVLPDRDGIAALREIKELFPRIRIVTISGAEDSEIYLTVSAQLGADASLSKSSVSILGSLLRLVLEQ